jgi:hypothetical protein
MVTLLDYLILFVINPFGFLISWTLLIYAIYLTAESIVSDPLSAPLRQVINQVKSRFFSQSEPNYFQENVLDMLAQKEHSSVKEISESSGLEPSVARVLMQQLVAKGYATRYKSPYDRRSYYYTISEHYKRHRA